MRSIAGAVLVASALAAPALASDGAIEVNQACALAGCFPGDAPGFPVTLPDPGRYVLTGDLVHDPATHGNVAIVVVGADDVSVDLNGFGLRSVSTCQTSSCQTGGVQGIVGIGSDRVSVRDGRITGVDANCIWLGDQARVENVVLEHCALNGISVGAYSIVSNSSMISTGRNGLRSTTGTIYQSCRFAQNGLRNDVFVPDLTSSVSMEPRATGGNSCEDDLCGDGRPRYYLTATAVKGSSPLTACDPGFHMASLWELYDPSNLLYDVRRGAKDPDQGAGPPLIESGWVRTGASSSSGSTLGNCFLWTTDDPNSDGSLARLEPDPLRWVRSPGVCNLLTGVWCVED